MVNIIFPFLISILMGMGIGGGGLYIVYLTELISIDNTSARGTNLVFFIVSALAALIIHLRRRHFYPMQVIVMIAFGIVGSYIFSHLSNVIDPDIPKFFLGCILILGGGVSVFTSLKNFFKK